MEDTYQQFRDNWERQPEPVFEERDWNALEKKLDQENKKGRGVGLWPWIATALLLLLLGGYIFSLMELRRANQTISSFQLQKDTVLQTRIIHKTDTVFQSVIIEKPSTKYIVSRFASNYPALGDQNTFELFNASLSLFSNPDQKAVGAILNLPTYSLLSFSTPIEYRYPFEKTPDDQDRSEDVLTATNLKPLKPLEPALFPNLLPRPKLTAKPVERKQKKNIGTYLYAVRPKGFQLGVSSGWMFPFNEVESVEQQTKFSSALQGAIEFSSAFSMHLEIAYARSKYETDRMDESIGVPIIEPPLDDLSFIKAETSLSYLQYSLGARYLLTTKGKFKPFIEANYTTIHPLFFDVAYDFKNEAIGTEWSFDQFLRGGNRLSNFFLLRTGFEYRLTEHWNWRLRASYRDRWQEKNIRIPKMLGIDGGLFYRF